MKAKIPGGLKVIAWQQPTRLAQLALTRQTWTNPKPDHTITRIEFIPTGIKAAPFLAGITLELTTIGIPG